MGLMSIFTALVAYGLGSEYGAGNAPEAKRLPCLSYPKVVIGLRLDYLGSYRFLVFLINMLHVTCFRAWIGKAI